MPNNTSSSTLPALDKRGFLPEGVHTASLRELELFFATNVRRAHLLSEFRRFLHAHLLPEAKGLDLYVCGSYISAESAPKDFDCIVDVPAAEFPNRPALLHTLIGGHMSVIGGKISAERGWVLDQYSVDIAGNVLGFPGARDFVAYFQRVGEKIAPMRGLDKEDKRGIVKLPWPYL